MSGNLYSLKQPSFRLSFRIVELPHAYNGAPAITDVNNDGWSEPLYTYNDQGTIVTEDAGLFSGFPRIIAGLPTGYIPNAVQFADFNNDGFMDAFLSSYATETDIRSYARLFFGSPQGFVEMPDNMPWLGGFMETVLVADFNGDGSVDIFLPTYHRDNETGSRLLINDGSGHFSDVTAIATVDGIAGKLSLKGFGGIYDTLMPEGAQALDINEDGRIDFFVASHLFVNQGNFAFTDRAAELGLLLRFDEGIKFVDLNNDGHLDFITHNQGHGPLVFMWDAGVYEPRFDSIVGMATVTASYGMQTLDLNTDGFVDLWVNGDEKGAPIQLFINDKRGHLVRAEAGVLGNFGVGMPVPASADFNHDGAMDFYRPALSPFLPIIAYNTIMPKYGSVAISVVDHDGQQNQFGRVVRVADDADASKVQTAVVDSSSGYKSQSEYALTLALTSSASRTVSVSPFFYGDAGYQFRLSAGFSAKVYASTLTNGARVEINAEFTNQLAASVRLIGGGNGDDLLYGSDLADVLQGNAGNDSLNGGWGVDTLSGGAGNDVYFLSNDAVDVIQDDGLASDVDIAIVPDELAHYILAGDLENASMDVAIKTNSQLFGNKLANKLTANAGNNLLGGKSGNDTLFAGAGNDTLKGGVGADQLVGGTGNDVYFVDDKRDVVRETAARASVPNTDTVNSSIDYSLPSRVENLKLSGTAAINATGNELDNVLIGNAGDNILNGLDGNDTLNGMMGADSLIGGAGQDVFILGLDINQLADFNVDDDTIRLEHAVFTSLNDTGVLAIDAFTIGTAATTSSNRIVYNQDSGALYYDDDGSGAHAAVQIATIGVKLALTAADFVVV